jgi:hypothetical protein
MRTLPRGTVGLDAAGAGAGLPRSSPLRPKGAQLGVPADGDRLESGEEDDGENREGDASRYATVASYRTAHEGESSEGNEVPAAQALEKKRGGGRGDRDALRTMWDEQDDAEVGGLTAWADGLWISPGSTLPLTWFFHL